MRISDWSSDVCSSDLACFSFPVEGFENAFASQGAAATCAKHAVGAHDDRAGFSEAFDAEMIVSGYRGRLIAHLMPFQTLDGDMVLDSDGNAMERPQLFAACDRSIGCPGLLKCTRSEEHTSELQSLMRISYAVFCLQKKNTQNK